MATLLALTIKRLRIRDEEHIGCIDLGVQVVSLILSLQLQLLRIGSLK